MDGELAKWVQQQRDEANARATEVIARLQDALLAIPPFKLADGTEARIEPYKPTGVNHEDQVECGIDVLLRGKGHLEFTLTNTGWGKAFAPTRAGPKNGPSRRGR